MKTFMHPDASKPLIERPQSAAELLAKMPPVDEFREEAARCCDETAKYERKERGVLVDGEFSDDALCVALEVAFVVGDALKAAGMGWHADAPWKAAAMLLRAGWKRGDDVQPFAIQEGSQT